MVAPRISKWVMLTMHGTQEGSERITTHNYQWDTDITSQAEALQGAMDWWDQVQLAYRDCLSTSVQLNKVTLRTLYPSGSNFVAEYFPIGPFFGTRSGPATPANAAAGVQWRTGSPGRRFRGRNNLPGLAEGLTTGSRIDAALIAALGELALLLWAFNPTLGGPATLAVASRVGTVLTPIISWIIDEFIDSQRTRLITRGR